MAKIEIIIEKHDGGLLVPMRELIRCHDCKLGEPSIVPGSRNYYCHKHGNVHEPDWFCADGKKKGGWDHGRTDHSAVD